MASTAKNARGKQVAYRVQLGVPADLPPAHELERALELAALGVDEAPPLRQRYLATIAEEGVRIELPVLVEEVPNLPPELEAFLLGAAYWILGNLDLALAEQRVLLGAEVGRPTALLGQD